MDVFLGNPAGRLYRFLEFCRNEDPNAPILHAWANYLGMSRSPAAEVVATISPLLALPNTIEDLLHDLPDHEAHREDFGPALQKAREALSFCVALNNGLQSMLSVYDAGTVTALRMCSRVLQRENYSAVVSEDQVDEVRQRATELINAINEAGDLPSSVRATLLGYAHAALRDLDLFNVAGVDALVDSLDRFRGQVSRDPGLVSALVPNKGVWQAVVRFSEALLVITSLIHTPLAIMEDVHDYQAELIAIPTLVVAPSETIAQPQQ